MKRFLAVERALRTAAPHELLDAIRAVLIEQYGAEDVELFMADSSLSVLQPVSVLPRTLEPVSVHNSPPGRAFGSQQPYREEGRNGQTVCATTGSACCRSRCPTATPLTAQPTGRGRTYVHALRQSGEIEPRFRLQDPKSPQLVRRQPRTRPLGGHRPHVRETVHGIGDLQRDGEWVITRSARPAVPRATGTSHTRIAFSNRLAMQIPPSFNRGEHIRRLGLDASRDLVSPSGRE